MSQSEAPYPGLFRRLAALVYDSMLVTAIVIAATALLLPVTGGEAIDALGPATLLYQAYLLTVVFLFFGYCWTHGGQTLGMKAWRLRLRRADSGPVTWRAAILRYGAALLAWVPLVLIFILSYQMGLASIAWIPVAGVFLWSLGSRQRPAWHDHLAGTRVVVEPRE
ncbi:RDD family protein [Aquisalimonas sp.]|uniref:RDD family protein n=1 Tax=Aquisalimonas sp. TaxID=1872621 RepID=UPI0025BF0EF3|nr:RDD family protein [Aquisalimonas sp.]